MQVSHFIKQAAEMLSLFLTVSSVHASSVAIEVFADKPIVSVPDIQGANIVWHDLSRADQIKQQSPRFTARTTREAELKARAWYDSEAGLAYQEAVTSATVPFGRMTALRITKVPAIVFDEKFVVYGTTNIRTAWEDYHAFIER